MAPSHTLIEHTGEIRVRLEAPSLRELFVEAGRALAELMAGESPKGPLEGPERVTVRASDREALLVEWMNELIARSEIDKRVYTELQIDRLTHDELSAAISGPSIRELRTAVKAATYHGLVIREEAGGLTAEVVLDV